MIKQRELEHVQNKR
uniref:Uncharacterized protein n=1 Tax=Rhizophora mucronata TaxID=61149 RepID=A0A2P2PZR4_RHIMU